MSDAEGLTNVDTDISDISDSEEEHNNGLDELNAMVGGMLAAFFTCKDTESDRTYNIAECILELKKSIDTNTKCMIKMMSVKK